MLKKVISLFLVGVLTIPAFAVDISAAGLNIPNIIDVPVAEKSGPGRQSAELVMESPIDPSSYRLGPGDTIAVHIIIGDAELSVDHNLQVGADGKVFFPNIGEIYLSGLSLSQAKTKLQERISSEYHESYKLSVMLSQPKKVKIYLSGMVKNPGPIAVYDNMRVSEVLAMAGGTASGASNRYVHIKRKANDGEEKILVADLFTAYRSRDISKDIRIQAGDVVEVPDARNELISQNKIDSANDELLFEGKETFVYVYGEVSKSGRFEYVPGKHISDYISYAGGPTTKALLNGVTLTRKENGNSKKYSVNVSDVLYNGKYEKDMEVMGGDVISVPGNFFYFADFASFVNTVLLGLTLYNTVARR